MHVVGVRLESDAEHRNGLAADRAVERGNDLARYGALALIVDRSDGFDAG
jgi:hypothetical protein